MTRTHRHLLATLGLLVLPAILLWPCLFGSRTFVPWDIAQFPPARTLMTDADYAQVMRNNNTDVTEIPVMFLPELRFIKDELRRGEFPQWNPYARSGTTVWSSSILGLWYPINWIMLLPDDPADALAIGGFLSIGIAVLLMYGFLIHLGLSIPAALFGALAFGLSGTLTVNLHFYQRINALIWLPGILWAISAIGRRSGRQRLPAALGLAVCLFMCHTAGFPPFALVVTLVAIAFSVRQLVLYWIENDTVGTVKLAAAIGGAALLGVLLASVQTLPMAEFFPESNRTMQAAGNSLAAGGFDPAGLLGYLFPTLFTHPHINRTDALSDLWSPLFWYLYTRRSWLPAEGIPAGTVFQPNLNFCEYTVFVGTATLLLALVGVLSRGFAARRFAAGAVIALFVLASANYFVGPILEAPPFRWVPPSRYTGATCMFVAMLAAIGVQTLPDLGDRARRTLWVSALLAGAVFLALSLWFAAEYTGQSFLQELTPGLQQKYAARFPHVQIEALPEMIQSERRMGGSADLALRKVVVNLRESGIALLATAFLLFILPLAKRRRRGALGVQLGIGLLVAFELFWFGMPLNTGRELYGRPLNQTPVHGFLRGQRDAARDAGGFAVLRAHDTAKHSPVTVPSQLPPDTLLRERIRDHQAYTFVDRRSHLPVLQLYGPGQLSRNTWAMSIPDDEKLRHRYWDMIGVRFVLSEDRLRYAGERVGPVLSGPPDLPEDQRTRFFYVYERPNPLPRAWVVHDVRHAPKGPNRRVPAYMEDTPATKEDMDIATALVDPDFRPDRWAILDDATLQELGEDRFRSTKPGNDRPVTFPVPDETNSLTMDVAPGDAGYLIVNDTMMKGWTVTVDGVTSTLHRANLFQRMVVLPAAEESTRVVFSYSTPGFTVGAGLSLAALLVLLALLGPAMASRRRLPNAESPS